MAAITIQNINAAGLTPVAGVAATASDTCAIEDEKVFVEYTVGATATTITVVVPNNTEYGQPQPDVVYTGLTNTTKRIRMNKAFNDGNGSAVITTSQQTAVTVQAFRLA